MKRASAAVAVVLLSWTSPSGAEEPFGLPLSGEAAETFLRTAEVVRKRALGTGITRPDQYTLSDGTRELKAVWKTVDEFKRGATSFDGGGLILDFADSWKYEVAVYELDKLLSLGLVPPTVERTFGRTSGSLQLWVEGAMTELERKDRKLVPPDPEAWNRQMYKVRLLHNLTDNTDYRNIRNVLSDPSFRVYAIDFSRAFSIYPHLRSPKALDRFSRPVLGAMRALDQQTLEERIGRWVSGGRIKSLLTRRDKLVELAEKRVRERGEAAVLYDE
jgi:hypothetical protein